MRNQGRETNSLKEKVESMYGKNHEQGKGVHVQGRTWSQ